MASNDLGPFGLLSAAGFASLTLLATARKLGRSNWPVSADKTAKLACLAGVGTVLLWTGNDQTTPKTHGQPDDSERGSS